MKDKNNTGIPDSEQNQTMKNAPEGKAADEKKLAAKRHLIHPTWLRRTLKTLMWVLVAILLIPVLLYIPPVQTFVKNVACSQVEKATGMKIGVEHFRLRFPLDVEISGVSVIEASGDTMVTAKKAIADVKLLPLLSLDVRLKQLELEDGYYRMVSPDSSMILKVRAGLLRVSGGSSANISKSEILLKEAYLKDGNMSLYMNVWKQKPTPKDTTSTPFLIKADKLHLDNFSFGMSMLPTIDTLRLNTRKLNLDKAVIDLRSNNITAKMLAVDGGDATYIQPTPQYIASHPAPAPDTTAAPSAPIRILADSISLDNFKALYATKGAKPLPGFDAAYIQVDDVAIGMKNFYNEASTVVLPLTRLRAKERSGLSITEGGGTVKVDSTGLAIDGLHIRTPYSHASVTAGVPFALMALKPEAPLDVKADALLGIPDIEAFMPALKEYTRYLTARNPVSAKIEAYGTLGAVEIPRLDAAVAGVLSLRAKGHADNALDYKRLRAALTFDGELQNPAVAEKIIGPMGFDIPTFKIKGTAGAEGQAYRADMSLTSPQGDVAAKGHVSLTAESYDADVEVRDVNVEHFAKDLGIGRVTARLKANGAGFNPEKAGAHTAVALDAISVWYNGHELRDIRADVTLHQGEYTIDASSPNPLMDFSLTGRGTIAPDNYTFDVMARLNNLDLQALGMTPDMNNGKGTVYLTGTASPARWLYNARLDVEGVDWNLPGEYIHIPSGLGATLVATADHTECKVDGYRTNLTFESGTGLERVVDSFTKVASMASRQLASKRIAVDSISALLPQFTLTANASGNGLLRQFLESSDMAFDSVSARISKDSLISGNVSLLELKSGTMKLDTITLGLQERRNLLDYAIHLGNRPGTMDEFANVNVNGYLGENRLSSYLVQRNIKNEIGYRLGFTASLNDSIVSLHLTPLKATIAYLPWELNLDNHIDCNLYTYKVDANLKASSNQSSILVMTEPLARGGDELHVNLTNIRIQDFTQMIVNAPPVRGSINSDIRVSKDGKLLKGKGKLEVNDLYYDNHRMGDFLLGLTAGLDDDGLTKAWLGLRVNGKNAMALQAELVADSLGAMQPKNMRLRLLDFPLSIANPFLGADVAQLRGALKGEMSLTGSFTKPILNGNLMCDSVAVFVPMMASSIKFGSDSLKMVDNIVKFDNFDIYGQNSNPLTINGTVDATSFSNIRLDLGINANEFMLVNNDRRARSDLYGKLLLNLDGSIKGPVSLLDINANLNILGKTDVTYTTPETVQQITGTDAEGVVKFVNFSDTTQVAKADSVAPAMRMRVNANLTLSSGMQATVVIAGTGVGSGKVELTPSGSLTYFQNYMGDMKLNGQINLGNGYARYNIPVMGEKKFDFLEGSYVAFTGDVMNPSFNIKAVDKVKANIQTGGNTRVVNFNVGLSIGNNLAKPDLKFDLSTDDDMTISNELAGMTAEQRSTCAMNMLITGQYTGPGAKTVNGNFVTSNLYSMLTSQINSWAANNIRGVDLSFGVNQFEAGTNGQTSTKMSYSYQVSKSLLNNRLKIIVGGNYSTDASADENLSQNLISNISFEYMIKQTNSMSLAAKLFRHNDYENVLEGEVTETGVGVVMRRRLSTLRRLFRFGRRKAKAVETVDTVVRPDSIQIKTK